MTDKAAHLMKYVDLERPELSAVRSAARPAEALVKHLATPPRPRFRFEYERKAEIIAFLHERYDAWRQFNTAEADRLAGLSIEQARAPRALANLAELGRAWWATGDPKYGDAFQRFYLSVPTGEMFNWDSFNGAQGALELNAFFLLADCPGFTMDGRIAFLDHLLAITSFAWDDATSQWSQLALGPEGHNWYLHGMHVLPFVGLLFPEFKRSAFFLRTGWSVIEEHLRGHYKSDGGARETTFGYQFGCMSSLWDFYLIAHRNGHPMSAGFADRVLNATKFLLRLATPAGSLPSFGDTWPESGQLTQIAAIAAALTGDRECKWYAEHFRSLRSGSAAESPGEIPLSAFWEVGLQGAAAYSHVRPVNPNNVSLLMGPTGYVVLRDNEAPDARFMAVAAADRGTIVTSHGHNEIFSLEVHADGVKFIGEMGCAPYGTSPGRDYDEKTEAHTCLAIEGLEQVPILSEWRWSERVSPCVRRWISEPTHDFFHGVHEGYYKYRTHDLFHARKIFFLKSSESVGGYWIVMDWIESLQQNDYRAYFHGCVPARLDGKSIVLEDRGERLAILPPEGDDLAVQPVCSEGLAAFIREKKLNPERYPAFVYGKRSASDCFVWVLVPLKKGEAIPKVRRLPVTVNGIKEDPHGAAAVEIAFPIHTDTFCLSHKDFDADLEFGGQRAWGFLSFRRIGADGKRGLRIEHTVTDGECGR